LFARNGRRAQSAPSLFLGELLFDERLSRPAWHVVVAVCGLALAMLGAVAISIARERTGRAPVAA